MFYKAVMGKRKYVEQVCILGKALSGWCRMWSGSCRIFSLKQIELILKQYLWITLQMMKKWCLQI